MANKKSHGKGGFTTEFYNLYLPSGIQEDPKLKQFPNMSLFGIVMFISGKNYSPYIHVAHGQMCKLPLKYLLKT